MSFLKWYKNQCIWKYSPWVYLKIQINWINALLKEIYDYMSGYWVTLYIKMVTGNSNITEEKFIINTAVWYLFNVYIISYYN